MNMFLNFFSILFALGGIGYAVFCYITSTFVDKTRESNYIDTWFTLAAVCCITDLLAALLNGMTDAGYLPVNLEYLPAFRVTLFYLKLLTVYFVFMMLLKSPKKVVFLKINKTMTFLSVFYNIGTPLLIIFFFTFRIPTLETTISIIQDFDDLVMFPIIENIFRFGLVLFIIMGLVAYVCLRITNRTIFIREWLTFIIITAFTLFFNIAAENNWLASYEKSGLYVIYHVLYGYFFLRFGSFLKFDGLKMKYKVGLI